MYGKHWVNVLWTAEQAVVVDSTNLSRNSDLHEQLMKVFDSLIFIDAERQIDSWTCGYRTVQMAAWLFPEIPRKSMTLEDVRARVSKFRFCTVSLQMDMHYLAAVSWYEELYGDYVHIARGVDTFREAVASDNVKEVLRLHINIEHKFLYYAHQSSQTDNLAVQAPLV